MFRDMHLHLGKLIHSYPPVTQTIRQNHLHYVSHVAVTPCLLLDQKLSFSICDQAWMPHSKAPITLRLEAIRSVRILLLYLFWNQGRGRKCNPLIY
jgi:hypothetical protein